MNETEFINAHLHVILPLTIVAFFILLCIIYHIVAQWYKRRSRAAPTRSGGSADTAIEEYMTASPPEYSAAIDMPRDVQTISSNELDTSTLQRPPSYETATSGVFKLFIPGGCPTPPGAHTTTPASGDSHKETEGGQRNEGYDGEEEGERNEGYVGEEEGQRNEGYASDEERQRNERHVDEGHHNMSYLPDDYSRVSSSLPDQILSPPNLTLRQRSSNGGLSGAGS